MATQRFDSSRRSARLVPMVLPVLLRAPQPRRLTPDRPLARRSPARGAIEKALSTSRSHLPVVVNVRRCCTGPTIREGFDHRDFSGCNECEATATLSRAGKQENQLIYYQGFLSPILRVQMRRWMLVRYYIRFAYASKHLQSESLFCCQ